MSQRLRSIMVRIRMVTMGLMMGIVWSGCGTGDFVPPPPPALGDTGGSGAPGSTAGSAAATKGPSVTASTVRSIEFIASQNLDPEDEAAEKSAARSQAGNEKARLHILPDDAPTSPDQSAARAQSQVELVRGAVSRKPQALIIE